ncbi:MAG: gliding motility-associated C-terminal domain-containing protein [Bacteroidota bacterium]
MFCCEAKTQTNLVYNGDFELYSSCPNVLTTPLQNPQEITKCLGWSAPTHGTSDYFNFCAALYVGIPNNYFGYQWAKSGNGYCGFHAYGVEILQSGYHWWEYIQDSLTSSLIANNTYSVSFYVSWAENQSGLCCKNIGAYVTNNRPLQLNSSSPLNLPAQIKDTVCRQDSLNWSLISGTFVAQGNERYITIGHFADSLSYDTALVKLSDGQYFASIYYYIDDVALTNITQIDTSKVIECVKIFPNVFTPNNDSANDVLRFKTCSEIIKTSIYNRWGNLVFETNKPNHSWDGRTTSGESCVDGTYFYMLQAKEKTYKGFIQLVR